MAKYMVLYNSMVSTSERMASASPEQMKASMDEWIKWREDANKTVKVDFGLPLQAGNRVTASGVMNSDSQVSGYSIVEAESEAAIIDLLLTHPHLQNPGTSIDVLEMLTMPGM